MLDKAGLESRRRLAGLAAGMRQRMEPWREETGAQQGLQAAMLPVAVAIAARRIVARCMSLRCSGGGMVDDTGSGSPSSQSGSF